MRHSLLPSAFTLLCAVLIFVSFHSPFNNTLFNYTADHTLFFSLLFKESSLVIDPLSKQIHYLLFNIQTGITVQTLLMHCCLFVREDQPFWYAHHSPYTGKHVLIECSDFSSNQNQVLTTDIDKKFF